MRSKKTSYVRAPSTAVEDLKVGQGYNDARGEIPDKEDIPKNNGQNLNNDPAHHRGNENQRTPPGVQRTKK